MNGLVVGIVKDNVDPDKLHRVRVEYPVESDGRVSSAWCRIATVRGLAAIPDVGTEVALLVSERSASPFVVGALHNGVDAPPYANEDGDDDLRVIWSRSGHLAVSDDRRQRVSLGAGAKALDVTTAPVWHTLDATGQTITQHSDADTSVEAGRTISLRCRRFEIEASGDIAVRTGNYEQRSKGATLTGASSAYEASRIDVNPSAKR